jgi:hypothetical protein
MVSHLIGVYGTKSKCGNYLESITFVLEFKAFLQIFKKLKDHDAVDVKMHR